MKSGPILIIDKVGIIGESLSLKLSKEFPVVYVGKSPSAHVPFSKSFPTIPDNKYSHIIVIDDEGAALEFLPKIIDKAKSINADFIFAQGLSLKGEYFVDKVLSMYSSSKVVLYGDIFDNKSFYRYEGFKSVINKFIYQAQRFGKIQILGDGLRTTYPVFINDMTDGLVDLVFGINSKHSLFYLFPKHPLTELSLAHMIQKANPEIGIDFIRNDPRKGTIQFPRNGKYLLEDKYALSKKIKAIDVGRKIKFEEKKNSQRKPQKRKNISLNILWVIIFLIFAPLIFTLLFSFLGINTLYYAKTQIDKGNFSNAKSSLHLSNTFFYVGKKTSDALYFQLNFIRRENDLKRLLKNIDLGHKISEAVLQVFNSEIYFSKILTGKSKNPADDFAKGENYLKSSVVVLEKMKAEKKIPASILQELEIINPLIKLLSNTSGILPGALGMEGPRTYLILFQNNTELRSGGGLIESYGILKFNMGKITQFTIHDVYDADRELRGHVEPPFALRRYLQTSHWYMRDSNFDIDFVKSASASSNFLYVETGQKVSGVIGVDVSFVKNILHAIGPVYVPDYGETVDENNLYMLIQAYSEKIFFPNSTQKKDFLRSLYRAIQEKVSRGNAQHLSVIRAISDSLSQKHLIFAFADNIQNIFTVNGWSSSLWDDRKESKNTINDFVGINESNLGINKVNYFIKRKISQNVKIENDGSLFGELIISYKNASTSWPGGDYKNYLRIIFPKETTISEVSINDNVQSIVDANTDPQIYEAKNFKKPQGLEVEKTTEGEKTIYGFLVNIPIEELVRVKIQYNTVRKTPFDSNSFSYDLKLFKQPGIDNLPYSFSLYYPDIQNVIKTSDGIKKGDGELSYSENVVEDKNLVIKFARK